jgi:D-alanyl-D-alanine carboxypeptidase
MISSNSIGLNSRLKWVDLLKFLLFGGFILLLSACQDVATAGLPPVTPSKVALLSKPTATPASIVRSAVNLDQAPPTLTLYPTSTPKPEPTATYTPLPSPTATPIGSCEERLPANGLTALVTLEYGIARDYVPPRLVSLSNHLPVTVTLGYPTQIREIAAEPLVEMIADMHAAGLKPTIISGYRSYQAQSVSWAKWQEKHPDRASIISAPPGHSEHQLGTTIDFGSPELPGLVGDEEIEFHTNFYLTSEGQWLAENAHKYGFILSFPRETFDLTGMYYEPWHFRYVGQEFAATLKETDASLISYQLDNQPPPCIP